MNIESIAQWAEQNLSNAGALKAFRQNHIQKFRKNAFSSDPEAYKFTNVTSIIDTLGDTDAEVAAPVLDERFYNLVFDNGELTSRPSVKGLTVRLLEDERIYKEFATVNPFTHLHHGLSRIIQIELDKNTKLDRPLKLTFLDSGINAPTVLFKVGHFSELSVFEDHAISQRSHIEASEIYFTIAEGAKVEHVQLDHSFSEGVHHHVTYSKVQKDATYRNVILHTGGKLIRRNVVTELLGPGSHTDSFALYLTAGEEHSDLSTVVHHLAADSTSEQIAKGILDGSSKGIFTGRIHIHKDAQRVASGQLNKNLLLSKKAQAHSQPQLEIFADDVKCSHGSTTGQLSPEEIFYFKARGIPEEKARTLLALGFGLEIVQKIASPPMRELAENKIREALKEKFKLGGQV